MSPTSLPTYIKPPSFEEIGISPPGVKDSELRNMKSFLNADRTDIEVNTIPTFYPLLIPLFITTSDLFNRSIPR